MTVEELKAQMRAQGLDPSLYDFKVTADGTIDIVDKDASTERPKVS